MKKVIALILAGVIVSCADQCSSPSAVDSTDASVACDDDSTSPGEVGQAAQEEVKTGN